MYRGRLAPSPTGFLHLGHARTFWTAQEHARDRQGTLILRNEDLDSARCRPEFVAAAVEDLRWFGLEWQEGPDRGGPLGPYSQSERYSLYRAALEQLRAGNFIYPCTCSRKDVLSSVAAPHENEQMARLIPNVGRASRLSSGSSHKEDSKGEAGGMRCPTLPDEPLYPGTCRPSAHSAFRIPHSAFNWRFRVPDAETISFTDNRLGPQQFVAGRDFGDFVVWRHDNVPAYQLAVVVDDAAMRITEVVRGEDLLVSTARQILLYRALALIPPAFYHCPLMKDESGHRLAKRRDALSLRALRASGLSPAECRAGWNSSELQIADSRHSG